MKYSWRTNVLNLGLAVFLCVLVQPVSNASGAMTSPADQTRPADVPVRKVMLFSSGVGYFEHVGVVTGSSHTELRFKVTQINDILKSLILQDLDGGYVDSVVYPSQDPVAKTLRSFQVDLSGNPPLAELLQQLRGSNIGVTIHAEQIQGTILGLEKRQRAGGDTNEPVEVWMLNLITGANVRAVPLDEVQRFELQDGQLQEEIHKALQALAESRDQAKKPVVITFRGDGERRVRIGYVVETPIWKTSYRLILPAHAADPPKLQGWAIVENQTESDWHDVQLSLVSGRPISFVQDLYAPLYIPRPVVKPELYMSLQPQTYDPGTEPPASQAKAPMAPAPPPKGRVRALAPSALASQESAAGESRQEDAFDPTASVIAVAAAREIGELFHYTVEHVSLPRQRSAMLPVVNDTLDAERVSIYNQKVLAKHPLQGTQVKNTTGKHLLQGPITVLDGQAYAGDARIDNLPPGQERLLSYAIDLHVLVNATPRPEESVIQTGKIVKGVLHLTRKQMLAQEYAIENKAERDKVLIVEHPLQTGWRLVDSPHPLETTDTLYRFKETVAAGKRTRLTVKEEKVQGEIIALLSADIDQLSVYSRTGAISEAVREVIAKAIRLKSALLDTQRQMRDTEQAVTNITQEQRRLRDNMSTVSPTSQYYARLLTKLNEQETQIENLQAEIEQLKRTYDQQRKELETFLLNTTIG
jgi:hypothetical protein